LQFKIRAVDGCGVRSPFRTKVITIKKRGQKVPKSTCTGDEPIVIEKKLARTVDDYNVKLAESMVQVWRHLLQNRKDWAHIATKQVFKRGRETDAIRA